MGRVREHMDVRGQRFWTLFDAGARNTYVVPRVAALLATSAMPGPFRAAVGGKVHKANQAAILDAEIEGCKLSTHAVVLDDTSASENSGSGIKRCTGKSCKYSLTFASQPGAERL
jgi:hypothetical protein